MSNRRINLIAVDMDGTLLNTHGELSERTIEAARAAMQRGASFVLSSGRMPRSLKRFTDAIGVNAPAVCYNGGAVVNMQTLEYLYKTPVSLDLALDIARRAEGMGLYLQAFTENGYIVHEYCEYTRQYEKLSGIEATVAGKKITEALTEAPMKLLVIDTPTGAEAIEAVLRGEFADRANIMRSQKHMVECVGRETGKGRALEFLAGKLNTSAEHALAFGDGKNDLDMLKWAGTSYVMQNASDELKHADERFLIAPSNAEDGVAQVIEKLLENSEIG